MGDVDDLAEDFGVRGGTPGFRLDRRGGPDKAKRAVEMLVAGVKWTVIAKKLRVTTGSVAKWRLNAIASGVTFPKRKRNGNGARAGSLHTCGRCGRLGHNRASCDEAKP
jgi:hypothetical protein